MEHAENWARTIGAGYLALASRRAGPFYAALDYEDSARLLQEELELAIATGARIHAGRWDQIT